MRTLFTLTIAVLVLVSKCRSETLVPCYFIFGDSLYDAGNNNNLNTKAKANYLPYGIDFPGGKPTGRFSNGRNFVDKISELLGFENYIPPYSTAEGEEILKGVNYASGSAGILKDTGTIMGENICMDKQIENHKNTIAKIGKLLGQVSANQSLEKCLYSISIGSNDFINYFKPDDYNWSSIYNPNQFADALILQYTQQIKGLYELGARRLALSGLGRIGCIPAELEMYNATECVPKINEAVDHFNSKLTSLIDSFNTTLPLAKFTLINLFSMQGMSEFTGLITDKACCKLRSDYQCEIESEACELRNEYVFIDGYHTTEAINDLSATMAFTLPVSLVVYPMSISQLITD
ncbi:unnamed protein product [Amaranthus hypochondriacus]